MIEDDSKFFFVHIKVGLGADRAQCMCPLAWLVEEGVPLALHSDFTMAPAQPLLLAWAAVNRTTVNGNVPRPGNFHIICMATSKLKRYKC